MNLGNFRTVLLFVSFIASIGIRAEIPFKPLEDRPVVAEETSQLDFIFTSSKNAHNAVRPSPDSGAQHRAIALEVAAELENFATNHVDSAWSAPARLFLANGFKAHASYSNAMTHYAEAWATTKNSTEISGQRMADQASGSLAKLLALTGRINELDALEADAKESKRGVAGGDWQWAREMRAWAKKHPTDAYKCGLHVLDQLGRLTQAGQFKSKDIVETESSLNGFTAADLVRKARKRA